MSALAEGGGSLAEFSYKLLNGDCPKSENLSATLDEPAKDICTVRPKTLTSDLGKVSEFAYLAGLSDERATSLSCTLNQITELTKDEASANAVANDVAEKVRLIAAENKKMKELWPQVDPGQGFKTTSLNSQSLDDGSGAKMARPAAPPQIKDPAALEAYRQALFRASSLKASIPFGDIPEQKDQVERMIAQAEAFDGAEAPASVVESMKEKYKRSLHEAQKQAFKSMKTMQQAAASTGSSLDTHMRESLAQDTDLVESYRQRHKDLEPTLKSISCRINAKYGQGAKVRDGALLAVSTVAGLGVAGATRMGAAASINALTGAAASGTMALRTASLLRWAAMGAANSAGGALSVRNITKACVSKEPSLGGNLGGGHRCENNAIKSLESNNCYLAGSLALLGAGSSGIGMYQAVLGKWGVKLPAAAQVAANPGKNAAAEVKATAVAATEQGPAGAAKAAGEKAASAADDVNPVALQKRASATSGEVDAVTGLQNRAARLKTKKALDVAGFDPKAVDMKDAALTEVPLIQSKSTSSAKDGAAAWMKSRSDRGVKYVIDDSKFSNKEDLAQAVNDKVILRSSALKDINSPAMRERIAHETQHALDYIKCQKTPDPANCAKLIRYKAAGDSKLAVKHYEDGFFANEYEANALGAKVSKGPEAKEAAQAFAKEETEILKAAQAKAQAGIPPDRVNELRREGVYSVALNDGRKVDVAIPFKGDSSPDYFQKAIAARMSTKHIQDELRGSGAVVPTRAELRAQVSAPAASYKPGYKIENGEVISKYRPSNLIPMTGKAADPLEVKSAGTLLKTPEDGKKFFASKEFRDGTHVFLVIRGDDNKDVIMIANRIPTGKDFEAGKYITHRSLLNRYAELTGKPAKEITADTAGASAAKAASEPRIPAGGEFNASMDRHLYKMNDRIGTAHFTDRYHPTAEYSADLLGANGLHVDDKSKVLNFRATDKNTHDAGHWDAAVAVRREQEIRKEYPTLLPKMRQFAERYLKEFPQLYGSDMEPARKIKSVWNNPALKQDPERAQAYRTIKEVTQYINESSTFAIDKVESAIKADPVRRQDIAKSLGLIEKYQDDYINEVRAALLSSPSKPSP